jgi:hypothetical protein
VSEATVGAATSPPDLDLDAVFDKVQRLLPRDVKFVSNTNAEKFNSAVKQWVAQGYSPLWDTHRVVPRGHHINSPEYGDFLFSIFMERGG